MIVTDKEHYCVYLNFMPTPHTDLIIVYAELELGDMALKLYCCILKLHRDTELNLDIWKSPREHFINDWMTKIKYHNICDQMFWYQY